MVFGAAAAAADGLVSLGNSMPWPLTTLGTMQTWSPVSINTANNINKSSHFRKLHVLCVRLPRRELRLTGPVCVCVRAALALNEHSFRVSIADRSVGKAGRKHNGARTRKRYSMQTTVIHFCLLRLYLHRILCLVFALRRELYCIRQCVAQKTFALRAPLFVQHTMFIHILAQWKKKRKQTTAAATKNLSYSCIRSHKPIISQSRTQNKLT